MATPTPIDANVTSWLEGIRRLNYRTARRRLRLDQDVNVRGEGGVTALHVAAEVGFLPIVRRLVQSRADLNATDDNGRTPLKVAQLHSRTNVVDYLIRHLQLVRALTKHLIDTRPGTMVPTPHQVHNALFESKLSAFRFDTQKRILAEGDKLVAAARSGDLETVRRLIEHGGVHVDSLDATTDETAFCAALAGGWLYVCEYLTERGADTNGRCSVDGTTRPALLIAVLVGNANFVERLLAHDSFISRIRVDHRTCELAEAVKSGSSEMVDVLLDAGAYFYGEIDRQQFPTIVYYAMTGHGIFDESLAIWQRLFIACWHQDVARVRKLFQTYAELRDRGMMATKGANALFLAAYQQNKQIVSELLARGAKINSQGPQGVTAAVAAVLVNSLCMLRFLVERGGDLGAEHKCITGGSAHRPAVSLLTTAIHAQAMDCVAFLLPTESRPDHFDDALEIAVQQSDEVIVRLLLDTALPSTERAFEWCCMKASSPAILDLLLTRCSAERYPITSDGVTRAFWLACIHPNANLVNIMVFVVHGANLNARNSRGPLLTQVAEAACSDMPQVIELLVDAGADHNDQDVHGRTALDIVEANIHDPSLAPDLRARYEVSRAILQGTGRASSCPAASTVVQ